jgi:hypothetical protein
MFVNMIFTVWWVQKQIAEVGEWAWSLVQPVKQVVVQELHPILMCSILLKTQ